MVGSITVPPTPFLIIVWDKYSDSVIVARLVSFQQKGGGGNPVEWIQMVGHHHPPPPAPLPNPRGQEFSLFCTDAQSLG